MEYVDRKLVIQGTEDGIEGIRNSVGQTMAIKEENGEAILTAPDDNVMF